MQGLKLEAEAEVGAAVATGLVSNARGWPPCTLGPPALPTTAPLHFAPAPQMKCYPRDWMVPGRVRVKLRKEDGTPVNPEVPTREWWPLRGCVGLGCVARMLLLSGRQGAACCAHMLGQAQVAKQIHQVSCALRRQAVAALVVHEIKVRPVVLTC